MSGKLNIKAASGGSVSLVVDDTLATDEEFNVSEGGIESGSNANGEYTKFPDGTLMQWGKVVINPTSNTGGENHIFPINFIDSNVVANASPEQTWSGSAAGIPVTNCYASSYDTLYLKLLSLANGGVLSYPADGMTMQWQATGRWK